MGDIFSRAEKVIAWLGRGALDWFLAKVYPALNEYTANVNLNSIRPDDALEMIPWTKVELSTPLTSESLAFLWIIFQRFLSTGQVTEENSVLLQKALEPHYIHEICGKDRQRRRWRFVTVTQLPPG